MNLTIDIGNSQIKTLIFDDTVPVYRNVSAKLTAGFFQSIKKNYPIQNTLISSVVDIDKNIFKKIKELPGFKIFSKSILIPLKNRYKTPDTLGYDRLANAIAGSFLFPDKNVLVIDVGTCIKYDFVNNGKEYLGGSISPGMEMRFKAMHVFTGKLPMVKVGDIKNLTGRSTLEAMQTGVLIGMTEEINGFINRYKKNYKALKVILTGGDSKRFAEVLNLPIFAAEDLVNIGLNEIIRFNQPGFSKK
jgi:type III pantothenate kinase